MLALGCTNHQTAIINDVIKITVLYDKRGHVVFGIDAPGSIIVWIQEVDPEIREIEKPLNVNV